MRKLCRILFATLWGGVRVDALIPTVIELKVLLHGRNRQNPTHARLVMAADDCGMVRAVYLCKLFLKAIRHTHHSEATSKKELAQCASKVTVSCKPGGRSV